MKRFVLKAVVLCALMFGTLGADIVTAKQETNPRRAGASSVYFFDVAATDTHGPGKLMIDLAEHTFIFNGKGFDPSKTYYLQYKLGNIPGIHTFASVMTTPSGNLHVEGTWTRDLATLPATPTFGLTTTTPLYAVLHWAFSNDPVTINGVTGFWCYFSAIGSSQAVGIRYTLTISATLGGMKTKQVIYDGPSIYLTNKEQLHSDDIFVTDNTAYSAYYYADLTISDLAGNSAVNSVDLIHDHPPSW